MVENLGRHHPTIRRLRALRRDADVRDSEGVFVAEGRHLARAALDASARVELAVSSPRLRETAEGRGLLERIEASVSSCCVTSDSVMDSLQDARSPQPVLLLIRRRSWPADAGLDEAAPLVVVAHGIQDPGNLGAVLRTAHAAGAHACYVTGDSADLFHPRAVRATMGAIFELPVHRDDDDDLLRRFAARGWVTLAADPQGSTPHHLCDLTRPCAIYLGREGQGLPRPLLLRLDETVRIPLRAGVDSLSVGAAAAVLLFEAVRQRGSFETRNRNDG